MPSTRVRPVAKDDVADVVTLVHELAEYEKAPEECHLTGEDLDAALFADQPALFGHVAELDGVAAGFALWFLNFSTWRGVHGIYLEDLYVRPAYRGHGLGKALLAELARECSRRGYGRLEWWVLDWNTPAIDFYRSVGAVAMDEWTVFRLTGDALTGLATHAGGARPAG
ncbi:L-amino acid N-acyltransferase YncA [Haloechinothrix alba]|uniref:L-amino acid N-acyltransferase YncA n=1 Tax=Haloechinothrix alba TaxID=664784 RepID=A0A238VBV7_9PSEU|nr:GNAT family N-acetyltransferase [Haloechinothrix alba]SNR31736.1 L-amino acid N-acyltransferase YncA [Haloechinothrix alba]